MKPEPIYLTTEEIQEITGAMKPATQIKRLRMMGFTVKTRPDNKPLIARGNYMKVMSATTDASKITETQPNFEAL